jgi:hypothetical protein
MTTRRGYLVALAAASLALMGTIGAATAYAVNADTAATALSSAAEGWNDGPGWRMDPDSMMGGTWGSSADFTVSADQARVKGQTWLSSSAPGATLGTAVQMPMGFRFPVSLNGAVIGVVMVNGLSGAVFGHAVGSGSSGWTDNWSAMMGGNGSSGWGYMMGDGSNTSGWGGMMR